jgi:hypothetical protein
MDDGHARRNVNKDGFVSSVSTEISTCCSYEEASIICKWFKDKHDVEFKPYKEKGFFSIRCNTQESHKFARIVQPHIIPSMLYKLSHVSDLSFHERMAPTGKCSKCEKDIYDKRQKGLCGKCYSLQYYRLVRRVREGRSDSPRGFYLG